MKHILAIAVVSCLFVAELSAQNEGLPFWDGAMDKASAEVMEQAAKDIEKYRKGDFVLKLVDESGRPVTGEAEADLSRHAFNFGVSFYRISSMKDKELKEKAMTAVKEIFNMITVCEYWREPNPKYNPDRPMKDIAWAKANNIRTRFHAVAYDLPRWIMDDAPTQKECWTMLEDRLKQVAERHAGVGHVEMDIINEFISGHYWKDHINFYEAVPGYPLFCKPKVAKKMMDMARKYLPDEKLIVLEAQTPSVYNEPFVETVDFWKDLMEIGGDFDYVGSQFHFFGGGCDFREGSRRFPHGKGAYNMSEIDKALELLGTIGKPVMITEFNGPSRNGTASIDQENKIWSLSDEENAAWQINFYRLAFSKPYIHEVTRWYLIDCIGGKALDAGLLTKDGKKHAVYDRLYDLINREWHTSVKAMVDNGELSFRGFYGDYTVTVPGYVPATVTLDETGTATVVITKE